MMSKQTTLLALAVAAIMSLALFMISYRVQDLETHLASLNKDIDQDTQAMHVLKAEWANLNDPERLRVLATRYLGLRPIATDQIGVIDQIPLRTPVPVADKKPAPPAAQAPRSQPVHLQPEVKVPTAQPVADKDADPMAAIRRVLRLKASEIRETGR